MSPIYIPDRWLAVSPDSGRHSIYFHKSRLRPCGQKRCHLVFVMVALPPPPDYYSGNEAQVRRPERLATLRAIISSKRDSVFIRVAQESLATLLKPSLSASAWGVNSCNSRLLLPSNDASPHRSPIPSLVTTPVSIATRMRVIRVPL